MCAEHVSILMHFPTLLPRYRRFAYVPRSSFGSLIDPRSPEASSCRSPGRGRRRRVWVLTQILPVDVAGALRGPPHQRDRWTDDRPSSSPRSALLAYRGGSDLVDDPILVLSLALAHSRLDLSTYWSSYFIAALGWGAVLGSLPPTSTGHDSAQRASRYAAWWLLVLAISVIVFAAGFSPQISLVTAIVAGAAGLFTGTAAQYLPSEGIREVPGRAFPPWPA